MTDSLNKSRNRKMKFGK